MYTVIFFFGVLAEPIEKCDTRQEEVSFNLEVPSQSTVCPPTSIHAFGAYKVVAGECLNCVSRGWSTLVDGLGKSLLEGFSNKKVPITHQRTRGPKFQSEFLSLVVFYQRIYTSFLPHPPAIVYAVSSRFFLLSDIIPARLLILFFFFPFF